MVQVAPYTLIISHCVGGIFFGMNCVLYAFCVYTLWGQESICYRLLLLTNTVQFLLCATQTILYTVLYFIVFTVFASNIQPFLHHVNSYILGHTIIFNINFIIAGFLSIWRLYVLYDNDIKICIPAFIVWIAQICTGAMVIRNCATTPVASIGFSPVNMLLWALITVLSLCVAIPISIRLYIAHKKTHAILSPSPLKSIAIVLIECGALIAVCSVAMTVLYACHYVYGLVSLGIATEIATASQLLVTARHGMLNQGRDTPSATSTPPKERPESRHVNAPTGPVKIQSLGLGAEPKSEDKNVWQPLDATETTSL